MKTRPFILLTVADGFTDDAIAKRVNTDHIEDYVPHGDDETMVTMTSGRTFRCSESVYAVDDKIAAVWGEE